MKTGELSDVVCTGVAVQHNSVMRVKCLELLCNSLLRA